VAEGFHVSERTVRDWLKKGRLKGFKFGRKWLIPENQVIYEQVASEVDDKEFVKDHPAEVVQAVEVYLQLKTREILSAKGKIAPPPYSSYRSYERSIMSPIRKRSKKFCSLEEEFEHAKAEKDVEKMSVLQSMIQAHLEEWITL